VSTSRDSREQLATLVRTQTADQECWERAETVMRAGSLRDRLATIGVEITPDVAAALMAAAVSLAQGTEEWGGDYRDALCDLAALGLELFEG
jgi:hypothetical protein